MNQQERKLLMDLIKLYDAMAANRHGRACECDVCVALEAVDNADTRVFAGLERKAKGCE